MKNLRDLFQALKVGSFELVCPRMTLRVAPGYQVEVFSGSGVVRSNPAIGFEAHMEGRAKVGLMKFLYPLGVYSLIEGDVPQWFQLHAWDSAGREWIGQDWVRPARRSELLSGGPPDSKVEIKARLMSMTTADISHVVPESQEFDQYYSLIPGVGRLLWAGWKEVETPGDREKPAANRRAGSHELDLGGVGIGLEADADNDTVEVIIRSRRGDMPPFVDNLVLQGLQFITARTLDYGVQYRCGPNRRSLRLVAAVGRSTRTQIVPPDWLVPNADPKSIWAMFDVLVTYLSKQKQSPLYNPMIDSLLLVMDASTMSRENYELVLSVAVEGIVANASMSDPDATDQRITMDELKAMEAYVKGFAGSPAAIKRVMGFLPRLVRWEVRDRLGKLVKGNVIEEAELKAWQKLRNPAAHSESAAIDESTRDRHSELVLAAIYKIILRQAGYAGALEVPR